jgi:hypothetical protein
MKLLVNVFAVILATLAFAATLSTPAHCESGQEAECETECACACCAAPVFTTVDRGSSLNANRAERAYFSDMSYMGKQSITDIFRPPISA